MRLNSDPLLTPRVALDGNSEDELLSEVGARVAEF